MIDDVRVFADTNTLIPFNLCDLLLRCAEEGMFEVLWTEDLLAEFLDVAVRLGKPDRAARSLCQAIRDEFADGEVPRHDYEHLIVEMPGNDSDDWVHSAAALVGGAAALLTNDKAGFPAEPLRQIGLRVTTADVFLCEQFDLFPNDLARVLDEQAADLKNPPLTVERLLDSLDHPTGAPNLVRQMRHFLGT